MFLNRILFVKSSIKNCIRIHKIKVGYKKIENLNNSDKKGSKMKANF